MAARDPENKYYPGKWLFYCDVCNRKMLSCDAKKRWDGLYVCKEDWEPRHPSDFIRARKETSNQLPWSRPGLNGQAGDAAAPSNGLVCTVAGRSAVPGYMMPGCAIPGFYPDLGIVPGSTGYTGIPGMGLSGEMLPGVG